MAKAIYKPLIPSGTRDNSRGADYVKATFDKFGVKNYAVLIDHTTVSEDLPDLPGYKQCGFFTFDINLVGNTLGDQEIKSITLSGPIPTCQGWLIASTSRAATFALNRALMLSKNEHQIIVRLYGGQVTEIGGYIDMFSGENETLIYINHYLNRKFGIVFPIDVRYTIRECDGTIRKSGQRIIAPGALTVIDSRKMDLGEFTGYLWLELEVENLQTNVPPFIHFYADYFNKTGIFCNHQSGLTPKRPNVVFNRAYMPIAGEMELTCSFYNINDCEIKPKALLHYNQHGEEKNLERFIDPIKPKHMSYQNISELFSDISFDGVNSAYILFTHDKPMHRPNHYLHPKGTKQFVNLNHQAIGRACHWTRSKRTFFGDSLKKLRQFNTNSCMISIPILDERFKIDSYLGLLSPTIRNISKFTFIIRNEKGEIVFSKDEILDGRSPQFINLNDYARKNGVNIKSGVFNLVPREGLDEAPAGTAYLLGFKHKDFKHMCFHPNDSKSHSNLPFYVEAQTPHALRYIHSPIQTTDSFGRGVVSEEFDSLYIVTNWSLLKNYSKECNYHLEIIDASGKTYSIPRTIAPQSQDVFWLYEILKEARTTSGDPYYTVWTKSCDTLLVGFQLLYRKSDHALSLMDTFEGAFSKLLPQLSEIKVENNEEPVDVQILRKIKKFIPRPVKRCIKRLFF